MRLLEEAIERRPEVVRSARFRSGVDLLALTVEGLGFLALPVRAVEEEPTGERYWQLQWQLAHLAAAILTVIDDLRERAGVSAYPDAEAVAAAIDRQLESFADYARRDAERQAERTGKPAAPRDPDSWRRWRSDDRPLATWLGYVGVYLGAGLADVIAGRDLPPGDLQLGAVPGALLLEPLEQLLDLLDWIEHSAEDPNQATRPSP